LAEETYEGREQLEEIMVRLTPNERRLMEMQLEEMDVDEMAAKLQCSTNAVYKRLRRVIAKARIINEKLNKR
jgi:DNA-directed RNA polymerase specialized sigma24 family protein